MALPGHRTHRGAELSSALLANYCRYVLYYGRLDLPADSTVLTKAGPAVPPVAAIRRAGTEQAEPSAGGCRLYWLLLASILALLST